MLHLNSSILKKQKIIFLPNIPRRREGIMHIRESEHKTKSLHQNPTKSINKFFKIKDQILYAFRFVFSKRKEGKKEGSKEGMEKEKKGRRREGRGRREEEGEKKPQEIKIILFPPLFSPTHLTFVMLQRPPPPPEVTTVNCWPGLPYVHTHGSEKVEVQTLGPDCVDLTCVILGSK